MINDVPLENTPETGLTLVAFYGAKPPAMGGFIAEIQGVLSTRLGRAFTAYDVEQVHGTIVGLEGRRTDQGIRNTNLSQATARPPPMDLKGLLHFMLHTPLLPLRVRFGGFSPSEAYPFTSSGMHPCIRSFTIKGAQAVVIGWPVTGGRYPMSLNDLRRQCTRYSVLHKYHRNANDIDNDFFLVLGQVEYSRVPKDMLQATQNAVRDLLSSRLPLEITFGREQLSVVVYKDRQLPGSSSVGYSLAEAQANLARIESLYDTQR